MLPNPTLTGPLTFAGEVAPTDVGMSEAGVRRIVETFEAQLRDGLHPGAQLVVLRHGRVVVDRAQGWANVARRLPVTPDTPFLTYSVTKPFAGLCVHRLIEQGRVELDAPIARYWPEFGTRGKERATVRHAFLHQAGIPSRGLNRQVFLWPNWQRITRSVAALPAEWEPGTRTAYHLVNYGFILGEVARRVSGLPIDLYLQQHFLNPLGLRNSWLGLPRAELARAADLLNGGEYVGRRFLARDTLAAATALGYEGHDELIGKAVRWAYGFQLGGRDPAKGIGGEVMGMGPGSTIRTFGHFGNGSCMAWADPDAALVVTFTCNRLLSATDSIARWHALSQAVWEAIET